MQKLLYTTFIFYGSGCFSFKLFSSIPSKNFGLEKILTYGAFSYPIAFLITDLANRSYGKIVARKIVYFGFTLGILFTLFFSTNFTDIISIRIAIGSGTAFVIAQLIDVQVFDKLRRKKNGLWHLCFHH